jgi:hypothetical protein
MSRLLDTVLLLALPASGKSEVRTFLANLPEAVCRDDFHMGPTVQLDDYPYVHMMRRVDEVLRGAGRDGVYFQANDRPFQDPRDWGTLIELLNEDFTALTTRPSFGGESAARHVMARMDAAADRAGSAPKVAPLPAEVHDLLARELEPEFRKLVDDLEAAWTDLDGRTIVIEFARGGPEGATMPLPAPLGYAHSLARLSPEILERASILYIWVTPEESRRKNVERTDPNDPGSILNHGVPEAVMRGDYGCDDMAHLIETSDRPGTVRVAAHDRVFHVPVARFDNRVDRTTFVRKGPANWTAAEVALLQAGLEQALDQLI